jgi:tetratricopeptide (TPR) repeat protein
LAKAYRLMEDGRQAQALKLLREFQAPAGQDALDPGQPDPRGYHHPEVYFMLGILHESLNEQGKARKAYQQTLEQDPDHAKARVNLARICQENEEYTRAADHFSRAYAAQGKEKPRYLYYAAVSLLMDDSPEKSIQYFNRLLAEHGQQIRAKWRENLIHALLSAGRNQEALKHIQVLVKEYSGEKRLQWQEILLYQYLELEMHDRAYSFVLDLTRQAPTLDKWWKAAAHTALAQNKYEQAATALTVYSYLTPLNQEEAGLLADLYLQVDIPVKAVPVYRLVLAKTKDTRILQNLIVAFRQLGEPEKALEALRAYSGQEEDSGLLLLQADLLYELERFEPAAEIYRQAAGQGGKQAGRAWLMAGHALWNQNELKVALQAFEQAVKYKKQRDEAHKALQRLKQLTSKS